MQEHTPITITHATVGAALPSAGLKQGAIVYLAWDEQARRLFILQWQCAAWSCSCGVGKCPHKLAVNQYVFALSQARAATGDG